MNKRMENDRVKAVQRWVYVVFGILIMMCLGTVYSYSIFRAPVEELFHAGTTKSGFPYMTALAFYSIFMFLTGRFLDRYKPRNIILVGCVLVVLGWILSMYAPNIYVLTLTYGLIGGSGVGIVYGAPMTVVARWFPEKKGLTVGFVLVGFGLSPLVTAPLAGRLIEAYGLRRTFFIIGIAFLFLIPLLSIPFRYPSDEEESLFMQKARKGSNGADLDTRTMVKTKSFKGLYSCFILGSMIGLMLVGMTSSVGKELIGLSAKEVAGLVSIFAILNGIGRPAFGYITDKISVKRAMLLSYVLIVTASILMLFANQGSKLLFVIAFVIFWFNLGGWLAIAPAATLSMYGVHHYSQNYGVVFTAYGIAAVVGVSTSGIIIDYFKHYHYVFYFIIVMCTIGIVLSRWLFRE